MSTSPGKHPAELKERCVRLVRKLMPEEPALSKNQAIKRVAPKVGVVADTLRGWVDQADLDAGRKAGTTTEDGKRIKELEKELREVKRANEILCEPTCLSTRWRWLWRADTGRAATPLGSCTMATWAARADSTGRRNTLTGRVMMGRPAGWLKELTGRNPMISPGHPGTRRGIEREFWKVVATGVTSEDAASAVGVSPAVGARWFRQGDAEAHCEIGYLTVRLRWRPRPRVQCAVSIDSFIRAHLPRVCQQALGRRPWLVAADPITIAVVGVLDPTFACAFAFVIEVDMDEAVALGHLAGAS